jgi:hypothetical protein
MKIIYTIFLFIITKVFAFAQTETLIIPGIGIGEIKLGMTKNSIIKVMGMPIDSSNYQEHKTSLEKTGVNTDTYIHFTIGFDKVLDYDIDKTLKIKYPIYRFYLKNDTLVSLILSAFDVKKSKIKKYKTKEGIGFLSKEKKLISIMGNPTAILNSSDFLIFHDYIYFNKGVNFVAHKNKIYTIEIFNPMQEQEYNIMLKKQNK